MKNKKVALGFILSTLLLASCGDIDASANINSADTSNGKGVGYSVADNVTDIATNSYGNEVVRTEQSQIHFNQIQPAEKLDWSLEREQLNERLKLWNDPNKISYIYLMSDTGTMVGYFPIKGKVSSVNSKLTNTSQLIYNDYSTSDVVNGVVESPDMDGSYGSNGDAVFFFLTDGTYMEWNGKFLLCDNPIKLTQEPLMIYETQE